MVDCRALTFRPSASFKLKTMRASAPAGDMLELLFGYITAKCIAGPLLYEIVSWLLALRSMCTAAPVQACSNCCQRGLCG